MSEPPVVCTCSYKPVKQPDGSVAFERIPSPRCEVHR